MSDQSPLIVPIIVEAFVVNDHTRRTGSFYRAQMQYNNIADPGNGDLGSTDLHFIDQTNPQWSKYYNGVYLKWRLPDALTRGLASEGAPPQFPCVPNRWLVVRYAPLSASAPIAWIIESDYLWPSNTPTPANASQVGSMYVQAASQTDNTPVGVRMGRSVGLAGGSAWTEPGHSLKLTAVAPGNPAFAYYQPACNNVFSLIDPLEGHTPDPDTFSYQVFGWFSNAGDDPLAFDKNCDFACLLEKLGWRRAPETDPTLTATWSLLCGMVTGVAWQTAKIPAGGTPHENPPVSLAVGNTAVEALTALIAGQGGDAVDTDLLEAFQLGLLDVLDKPDAAAVLADAVHSSFFQKFTGGYVWEIVDAPGVNSELDQAELQKELQWLAVLNQDQELLDQAERTLADLRQQLYIMWWKYVNYVNQEPVSTDIPNLTQTALAQQLDPKVDKSLAFQVSEQQKKVASLSVPTRVPNGISPAALQTAIDNFASAHQLPAGRVLKRASAPVFYEAHDPVLLIAGAGASGIVRKQATLDCRFPSQIIGGFQCGTTKITAATPKLTIPLPNLTAVSGVPWLLTDQPKKLFQEFFFLDRNNAAAIATATGLKVDEVQAAMDHSASYQHLGTLPAFPGGDATWTTSPWLWARNPWHPLLLIYQADYYPIDYGTSEHPNWTFANGQYTWNGEGAHPINSRVTVRGILQLSPAAAFNMQARIQAFLKNNPNLSPKTEQEFQNLLKFFAADNWDLLSQALDGFNQQLLLNLPGVWLGPGTPLDPVASLGRPEDSLQQLIGPGHGNPPGLGDIPDSAPYTSNFLPWRCGQFVFRDLKVVDEWGQAVYPIDSNNYMTETLYLPPEMKPQPKVIPSPPPDSVMQLTPALLQAGRLDFDFVSATNDKDPIRLHPTADPVCGWVLPNHLDASLMAYDAQGQALGELSIAIAADDQTAVCWMDAPGSPYSGLDDINAKIKHFGPFLWNLKKQGPVIFAAFLKTIDETLWTTLPLRAAFDEELAALIGRPLAMVRSQLQFELDGPPYSDPSWQYTFPWVAPPPPPPAPLTVTGYQFAIELGDAAQLEDGLIGYFRGDDYTQFNVTHPAAGSGTYLKPIGVNNNYIYLPFDGKSSEYVSLLVDPRAAVHSRTGILPTAALALAPEWTTAALAAINVTFRIDGILTDSQTAVTLSEAPATILMPVPHLKHGTWAWVENDEGNWQHYATASNDTTARLANVLPVLRRGLLQLSDAVGARSSTPTSGAKPGDLKIR
jgi:hypothetical protein